MRWLKWFVAGALAVPLFHQAALWILNAVGFVSRAPYPMTPTNPFGVPSVISLSFWGGIWGLILGGVLRNTRASWYWPVAAILGAVAPTLVAVFVVAPIKGQAAGGDAKMLVTALTINAAWGLGTALLASLMRARNN